MGTPAEHLVRLRENLRAHKPEVVKQLTLTIGYLELLRDTPSLPPSVQVWAGTALEEAKEAAALVLRLQRLAERGAPVSARARYRGEA